MLASAEKGAGGNIEIRAKSLFGIAEGPLSDITNDINASSQFGLDGRVSIVTPDNNSLQSDIQLPNNPIKSEQIVPQACQNTSLARKLSGLTIKGKGGIPPTTNEPFVSDAILLEEQVIPSLAQFQYQDIEPIKTSTGDIYPARGIIKTEDGKIILTPYITQNNNIRTPHNSDNCNSF